MAKKAHGGTRKGAGRKPVEDPKIQFSIYPVKSAIDTLGIDKAREIAIEAIYKEVKKAKRVTNKS